MKLGPFALDQVHVGDCLELLRQLPEGCIQTVITSPPYWGLRDYGVEGQRGFEKTPDEYIENMVEIFRDVRRVLRDDGTLWLNLGDSYASDFKGSGGQSKKQDSNAGSRYKSKKLSHGLKPKDLVGIPWRVAFALQSDGWYLRSDIIWHKPNPMPESVTDRPTKAHEYLFLMTKSKKYFYDAEAIREPMNYPNRDIKKMIEGKDRLGGKHKVLDDKLFKASKHTNIGNKRGVGDPSGRNKRTVWTIPTASFKDAHFATFPKKLVEPCILAGTSDKGACSECGAPWERIIEILEHVGHKPRLDEKRFKGGSGEHKSNKTRQLGWKPTCKCEKSPRPCIVLDPFAGSGTTGVVAIENNRAFIGFELNEKYANELANPRLQSAIACIPEDEFLAGQGSFFS